MATDTEAFFTKTRPARLFFSAAIPGALGMVISSIYEVMDGVFVGQFVGETAFAAINLAMPFVIIDFAFGDLIGVGSAVPISIAHGAGERDKANNIFTCACLLNVVTGFLLGLALEEKIDFAVPVPEEAGVAAFPVVPGPLFSGRENQSLRCDAGEMDAVRGSRQTDLLPLVVVGAGIEQIPDALVFQDGRSLDAVALPFIIRLHQGAVGRV
jgi:hypothetical protein